MELSRVRLWVSGLSIALSGCGFKQYMTAMGEYDKFLGEPIEWDLPPMGC